MKSQSKSFAGRRLWRIVQLLIVLTFTLVPTLVQADDSSPVPPETAPLEGPREDVKATAAEIYRWESSTAPLTAPGATAWIAQGPAPTVNGQVENVFPNNEVVGAIHTVVAHPTDPNVLHVGAVNGGIWRTTNATAASPTWTPLTDDLQSLSIGALEFDPADSNRLLAGIGRFSSLARFGGLLTGLLLTNDGGDTWAQINHPLLLGENISGVAVRGNLLLASSNGFFSAGGLFRSTDEGINWTRVSGSNGLPNGAIFDLVGDPTEPNRFYVSLQRVGVFRSNDGGATWMNVSGGDATLNGVITQAGNNNTEMAVASNGRLYVAVLVNGRTQYIGFTDNEGAVWTAMDLPQTPESNGDIEGLNPSGGGLGAGGQGIIHFSIRADPSQPHIVYVAGDRQDSPFPNFIGAVDFSGRLFRGDTTIPATGQVPSPQWEHLTHRSNIAAIPGGGTFRSSSPHADSREMVFDVAGNLIEVDDGGIYRRTNPQDNSGDWFSIAGNIQTTEFHDVAYDSVSKIIIGGAQDTGTPEQITPGDSTWRSVSTADGGGVEVDNRSLTGMSIRYSSFQNLGGFRRRTYNSGNVLVSQVFPALTVTGGGNRLEPQFYTPIKLNAVDPVRLIIGGGNSVYESLNRGDTITEIGPAITVNDSLGMEAIAYGGRRAGVDNPDVLYVGSGARVFVRTAAAPAPLVASAAYPGGVVRDIALDPEDWMTAYVIDNNQVFVTGNGGASWTEITGNLSDGDLRGIVFVPAATNIIFVGGRSGIFRMLTSAPGVWSKVGIGLPNAVVFDLDYNAADDVLIAGMLGRGAWLLPNASRELPLQLVNDSVSFQPIAATFNTSLDTAGCPSGFAGRFSFDLMLANISNRSLFNLVAQTAVLTDENLLQNANGGPGGVGSRLTIPKKNDFADGTLSPGEFVDVSFVICLKKIKPFEFLVDILGLLDSGPVASAR